MRLTVAVFLFFLIASNLFGQKSYEIRGSILDSLTGSPLPYATINVENELLGAVSDYAGNFTLFVPKKFLEKRITFSFLGYHSAYRKIDTLNQKVWQIKLSPSAVELQEVVVNPLSPEELIKRCVDKIPQNYPDSAFISKGFYREILKENDNFLKFVEAFVNSYNYPYTDTTTSQSKIIEGRTRDDLKELQFMHNRIEKEKKKAEKKAIKNNEAFNKEDYEAIQLTLSNPNLILKADPARDLDPFMMEKNFGKFSYSYGALNTLGGKKLISIHFKQIKKIEHVMSNGTIYLDAETDALVSMDLKGEFFIPALVKPILFVLGLKFTNPKFHKIVEYRSVNDRWYLRKIQLVANATATKKRWFKANQVANFSMDYSYSITEVENRSSNPFKKEELITPDPLEKQLGPYNASFWLNHDKKDYSNH